MPKLFEERKVVHLFTCRKCQAICESQQGLNDHLQAHELQEMFDKEGQKGEGKKKGGYDFNAKKVDNSQRNFKPNPMIQPPKPKALPKR